MTINYMEETILSIIIVNWNTCDITRDCLQSITEHVSGMNYEVIIVDNASSDNSVEMIRSEFPQFQLIANEENVGFGRANNQAMRVAKGKYFLLLNSDTLILDDSIQRLTKFVARDASIGIAGCKLLFEDLTLQHSCYRFPSVRLAIIEDLMLYKLMPRRKQGEILLTGYWSYDQPLDVDWVMGAAMLLRREVFEQTGGFDEKLFMYGEEMEWCMRVRKKGWRITFTPDYKIVHLNHKSADKKYGDERIDLCQKRYYDIYRRTAGPLPTYAMLVVKTVGALIKASYFGLRARAKSGAHEYYDSQARFYNRSLKFHIRALSGQSLALE